MDSEKPSTAPGDAGLRPSPDEHIPPGSDRLRVGLLSLTVFEKQIPGAYDSSTTVVEAMQGMAERNFEPELCHDFVDARQRNACRHPHGEPE